MKNDPLVSALEEVARDEAALLDDPRWDALAAGTLSEREHAELRALAERSPAARRMYEAFRPLGDDALDRATDRVQGALAGSRARSATPRGRRWRPAIAAVGMAAAMAAAAIALVMVGGDAPPPVPAYELAVAGGDRDVRSTPDGPPDEAIVLGPRTRLEVTLRPATPVPGPIAVRAALIAGAKDGAARAWTPRAEISGDGAARLEITRADLPADLPPGPCEVLLAVGRPEGLPEGADALVERARRATGGGDAVRILSVHLVLRDPPGRAP